MWLFRPTVSIISLSIIYLVLCTCSVNYFVLCSVFAMALLQSNEISSICNYVIMQMSKMIPGECTRLLTGKIDKRTMYQSSKIRVHRALARTQDNNTNSRKGLILIHKFGKKWDFKQGQTHLRLGRMFQVAVLLDAWQARDHPLSDRITSNYY